MTSYQYQKAVLPDMAGPYIEAVPAADRAADTAVDTAADIVTVNPVDIRAAVKADC